MKEIEEGGNKIDDDYDETHDHLEKYLKRNRLKVSFLIQVILANQFIFMMMKSNC